MASIIASLSRWGQELEIMPVAIQTPVLDGLSNMVDLDVGHGIQIGNRPGNF